MTANTEDLRRALLAVLDEHKPYANPGSSKVYCDSDDCADSDGELTPYPCRTTQIIQREMGVPAVDTPHPLPKSVFFAPAGLNTVALYEGEL